LVSGIGTGILASMSLPVAKCGDTALLRLVLGDEWISLRLVFDPDGSQQALARAHGHGLSYLERQLIEPLRSIVLSAAQAFGALGDDVLATHEVVDVLGTLIPASTVLEYRRLIPAGQRLPRWPGTMRSGAARPLGENLWPFDPEVAAMRAGKRLLTKRDWLTAKHRDDDAAWLTGQGMLVRSAEAADARGRHVLFAALDAQTLTTAVDAEAALGASGDEREAAAHWLGRALGYPDCCRESFQRFGRRDDLTLAADLLPNLGAPSSSPLTQWINASLALVSHVPCSLDCAESVNLAAALLTELERERPGFTERWDALVRGVQVIDVAGRFYSLYVSGSFDSVIQVERAVEYCVPHTEDLTNVMHPVPELQGRRLEVAHGALVGEGFRAVLVADHRGSS
jgi:hypothetical protein